MTDFAPLAPREGVPTLAHKRHPAIERRIDKIVMLAQRRERLYAERDYWGLIELSYEYDSLKHMHDTARQIQAEAAYMEKHNG